MVAEPVGQYRVACGDAAQSQHDNATEHDPADTVTRLAERQDHAHPAEGRKQGALQQDEVRRQLMTQARQHEVHDS